MHFRNICRALVLGVATLLVVSCIQAQPHGGLMPPPGGGPFSPKKLLRELKKELNLTLDQEAKLQKIFDEQQKQMDQMFDLMEQQREEMFEKMEQQRKQTDEKIVTLLTEEQKKKFGELQKKRSRRFEHPPEPME